MAKLYPPIIPGTLPAFYTTEDGAVTKITVPFSMNKAVSSGSINGFALKLKTAYSNTLIDVLKKNIDNNFNFTSKEITFFWSNNSTLSKIKPGQFLKAQLAYINTNNNTETIGYYSTVGVIKYTDKPKLKIQEFEFENNSNEDDSNKIRTFCSTCTGIYTPGEDDKSERPYQYQFLLLDENDKEVENSGWLLHNNELDIGDTYTFKSKMEVLTIYKVQYNVKTINNLNESVEYKCLIPEEKINNPLILKAENIYEEGYINLSFSKKSNSSLNENDIPYIIDIYREEYGTNNQCFIHRIKIENDNDLNQNFKDFTIEQGITYLYYFKYNKNGYHSRICGDEDGNPIEVIADFEDMFLYDGQKQIKLRFNPKVSSFKINHLEQKTDVIGNRYPVFFRNSIVEYKEFPISGLISYHLDDNELFIQDSLQELGIQIKDSFERQNNPAEDFNYPTKSLNLISNNIKAERLFKMKLLDWLGNGEIKLFKSPSEGNYLVRLMNISLSPEDKLNRMLHTFSCTAYEAKEFNFENLEELGFININQNIQIETINKNIYYVKEEVKFYPNYSINISTLGTPVLGRPVIEPFHLQTLNNNESIIKSNVYLRKKEIALFEENNMILSKVYEEQINTGYRYTFLTINNNEIISKNFNQEEKININNWNYRAIYRSTKFNNTTQNADKSFSIDINENSKYLSIDNIYTYLLNMQEDQNENKNFGFGLGFSVYLDGYYIVKVEEINQE